MSSSEEREGERNNKYGWHRKMICQRSRAWVPPCILTAKGAWARSIPCRKQQVKLVTSESKQQEQVEVSCRSPRTPSKGKVTGLSLTCDAGSRHRLGKKRRSSLSLSFFPCFCSAREEVSLAPCRSAHTVSEWQRPSAMVSLRPPGPLLGLWKAVKTNYADV